MFPHINCQFSMWKYDDNLNCSDLKWKCVLQIKLVDKVRKISMLYQCQKGQTIDKINKKIQAGGIKMIK